MEKIASPGQRPIAILAGAVTLLIGLSVLSGWAMDLVFLKSLVPGQVSMKPNTAVCFGLLGLALIFQASQISGVAKFRTGLAGLTALIGTATLLQYFLQQDWGIDQILFREEDGTVGTSNPGRMSPLTAVGFVLLGV